jgi:hypothetical protein
METLFEEILKTNGTGEQSFTLSIQVSVPTVTDDGTYRCVITQQAEVAGSRIEHAPIEVICATKRRVLGEALMLVDTTIAMSNATIGPFALEDGDPYDSFLHDAVPEDMFRAQLNARASMQRLNKK